MCEHWEEASDDPLKDSGSLQRLLKTGCVESGGVTLPQSDVIPQEDSVCLWTLFDH